MIGVVARSSEQDAVREFFELFKTPWEFHRPDRHYEVLILASEEYLESRSKLVVIYGGQKTAFDAERRIEASPPRTGNVLLYEGERIPVYGNCITFRNEETLLLVDEATQQPAAFASRSNETTFVRVGFDLFREVQFLLTSGQTANHAAIPTLELQIACLQDLILRSGIPVIEIPPVPQGYNFVACLTHDVDHPVLRNHRCDHTMFGFLYRAILGSLINVCRGRKTAKSLFQNWAAACRLPFVYLGMAKDPWIGFDRYLGIEAGLGSTYFVIPKKNYPGRYATGGGPAKRASRYEVNEIRPQLDKIISAGCEVALHGIDAWLDSDSGVKERNGDGLFQAVGATEVGVRMHWLFFDKQSPAVLERAGFSYDSTVGYNETVGYRAGTTQAYKPPGVERLLELPLHVMDTALFYPSHLNLTDAGAEQVVGRLMDDMARFGGAMTINWHDRSIAPERSWNAFHLKLLHELKRRGAWFPTAGQAVSWFRKRRSATFDDVNEENGVVKFSVSANADPGLPGLRVRVHWPRARNLFQAKPATPARFVDVDFKVELETSFAFSD